MKVISKLTDMIELARLYAKNRKIDLKNLEMIQWLLPKGIEKGDVMLSFYIIEDDKH